LINNLILGFLELSFCHKHTTYTLDTFIVAVVYYILPLLLAQLATSVRVLAHAGPMRGGLGEYAAPGQIA